MDPNTLTNLDPKLRETYERVMGTTTPAPASSPPAAASDLKPSQPAATPAPDVSLTPPADSLSASVTPDSKSPLSPAPSVDSTPAADSLSEPVIPESAMSQEQPQNVTINQPLPDPTAGVIINKPHGHMGLIRVFYILGAVVFFVIYIFFWMKIFNIPFPFLS
jgi:hypothetical protein